VAVSKTQPVEAIAEAYACGQRDFGENYLQELFSKRDALSSSCPDIRWHFIGRVQRNKARDLGGLFRIHGVGSLAHAQAIAARVPQAAVLLQVNLEAEASKNGFGFEELHRELPAILALPLQVRGLMALPPPDVDPTLAFARVAALRDALSVHLPELSMGMSGDFRAAIACGATWVRVGSAIFGARTTS
jgi:hypothetical protein